MQLHLVGREQSKGLQPALCCHFPDFKQSHSVSVGVFFLLFLFSTCFVKKEEGSDVESIHTYHTQKQVQNSEAEREQKNKRKKKNR